VDLAVGTGITGEVTTTEPANALDLPRLVRHQYRLYLVVDQIADKVCATMTAYNQRMSSREKDLVDLVVFAPPRESTAPRCESPSPLRHADARWSRSIVWPCPQRGEPATSS
jgi:hypothetical protein